jgi:hypothetical protein
MHQHIILKKTTTNGWKIRVNRDKTVKTIFALLAILIVSTINVGATQTPPPLKVEVNTLASVSPANVFWAKTYGGTADDRAFYALPTSDGYLAIGSSRSIVINTTVGWVLRLNENGGVVWNKTFLEGWGTELRYAINLTDGYLLVGNEFFASGQVSGYVVRIDNQGDLQWMKNLAQGETCKLFSGIVTIDGFVVFGLSSQSIGGDSSVWAVKLDVSGNVVWSRTYGESVDSAARSGVLTREGDCLMAGYTDSKGDGNYDFYLLEINSTGDIVWNNTYGGEGSQKAYSIAKANGGYVVVGDIQIPKSATDAWVLKIDLAGNELWNRSVGGKDADSAAYAKTSKDGGYLVAGFTFSFGAGNRDFWLFKISDSGEVFWSCTQGDEAYQEAYAVIEADNAYVLVGWTDPIGNPALIGKATYNFSIVKLDVSQNSIGLSNFLLAIYVAVAIAVSFVILNLLIMWRAKEKNNVKS